MALTKVPAFCLTPEYAKLCLFPSCLVLQFFSFESVLYPWVDCDEFESICTHSLTFWFLQGNQTSGLDKWNRKAVLCSEAECIIIQYTSISPAVQICPLVFPPEQFFSSVGWEMWFKSCSLPIRNVFYSVLIAYFNK